MKNLKLLRLGLVYLVVLAVGHSDARADWQKEWEQTLSAAEKEGRVTVYGPPGAQYIDAIAEFETAYPRIKLVQVPGSGDQHSQRLFAERRAGRYLADVYVGGSGTGLVLASGNVFVPLPPALILPETGDGSRWFSGKLLYADAQGQVLLIMQGNVTATIAAYNTKLVSPEGVRSFWDLLNPKWKGKMATFDPSTAGQLQTWKGIYYNPKLGPEFIRRLFSEMNVTIGTDLRLLVDWVANGKFPLYIAPRTTEIKDAKGQGLPVDTIDAPPDEGRMSGGWGQVALINKAAHPNAAKVFLNWLLSKEGQLAWQKKSDNNSLRTDIPKDMLSDRDSVPKAGGQYLIAALPQYSDIAPIRKILKEVLKR